MSLMLPFTEERFRSQWEMWQDRPTFYWTPFILEDPLLLYSLLAYTRSQPKTHVDDYRTINQAILALGIGRVE